jgi:hypothetical protein
MARALEVPMCQLFYDGENSPPLTIPGVKGGWGSSGRDARTLWKFLHLLGRASQQDRNFLFLVAQKMSEKKHRTDRKTQAS